MSPFVGSPSEWLLLFVLFLIASLFVLTEMR
jgi:hypothetical protein